LLVDIFRSNIANEWMCCRGRLLSICVAKVCVKGVWGVEGGLTKTIEFWYNFSDTFCQKFGIFVTF
jgi:hypothetical protein